MKRLLVSLLLLASVPLAGDAEARYPRETDVHKSSDLAVSGETKPLLLSGVACNAAAANRTYTMESEAGLGYAVGTFQLDFTRSAATAVTITPTASVNGQTSWASIPPCDATTDGTCTLTGSGVYTRDVSGGSENIIFRVDFLGAQDIKLVVSCTAGGASDTFNLYGRVSTQ